MVFAPFEIHKNIISRAKLLKWKKCKSTNLSNKGRPSNILSHFNTFSMSLSLAHSHSLSCSAWLTHLFFFCGILMQSASVKWRRQTNSFTMGPAWLPDCLAHKVGGYISLGREIWTQESNWNDAVNGIYGLCAFYYYATSILSLPFSLFWLSAIFQHFPLLAISSRAKKETINGRWGWPTDAKHRLYYPLAFSVSLSISLSLSLPPSLALSRLFLANW